MKHAYFVLLLTGVLLLPLSCRENHGLENPENATELIARARLDFDAYRLAAAKASRTHSDQPLRVQQQTLKNALWEQAYLRPFENGPAVVVPVVYQHEIIARHANQTQVNLNGHSSLVIYRDAKGQSRIELVSFLPDQPWLEEQDAYQAATYSGQVLIEDWQGNFIKGFGFENQTVWQLGPPQVVEKQAGPKKSGREPAGRSCTTTDWYSCVINPENGTTFCNYNYTQTVCTPYYDSGDRGTTVRSEPSYYLSTHGGGGRNKTVKMPDAPAAGIAAGPKPMAEYKDKCVGVQAMWSNSTTNAKERVGFVTRDGGFIETQEGTYDGINVAGLMNFNGYVYYQYEQLKTDPIPTWPGTTINEAGLPPGSPYTRVYIPIVATIHTHNPCLTDGTNGVSHPVGTHDKQLAGSYTSIKHFTIGCGAIAEFNNTNASFYNVITGPLTNTCGNIK